MMVAYGTTSQQFDPICTSYLLCTCVFTVAIITVDKIGVDEMKVDELKADKKGVDELGVDEMETHQINKHFQIFPSDFFQTELEGMRGKV